MLEIPAVHPNMVVLGNHDKTPSGAQPLGVLSM
jgi:hypothetical protein